MDLAKQLPSYDKFIEEETIQFMKDYDSQSLLAQVKRDE